MGLIPAPIYDCGLAPGILCLLLTIMAIASSQLPNGSGKPGFSALRKLARLTSSKAELTTMLGAALEEILKTLEVEAGSICLLERNGSPAAEEVIRGTNSTLLSFLADRSRESAFFEVLHKDSDSSSSAGGETRSDIRCAAPGHGVGFNASIQLRSNSRALGIIQLVSEKDLRLDEEQKLFLAASADLLATACENAILREEAAKLSEDLITLQEVNKIISQSFDLEDIIRRIVIEGKRLVKTDECHLFLLEERPARLIGSASTETDGFDISRIELDLSVDSPPVRSLVEKRIIFRPDSREGGQQDAAFIEEMGWKAAVFAPLIYKDQGIGILVFSDRKQARTFAQQELFRAETLAHQAAIALENARLFHVVSRSHKEWETTFDAMQDCVSVHDTGGRVIRANVALTRRLNTTPPKVIARLCSEIYSSPEAEPGPCRHLAALESEGLIVEEIELPAMGGIFQLSVTPWYDKNNRLAGSIHVAKDISNEKHLQLQLIQSEKLSAIGQLISGIAHELNNPLTGVMGYSQLLQLRKDIDERAKESLLKINNLALRCQKIVQNLLSFARRQKPERTLCNINEILERTVDLRGYELQVNNIEINRDLDRRLPSTIADSHQLQQVFLNLITNAEQAMLEAHGHGKLTIRTRSDSQAGRIVVEIIDDGPGIPEGYLTRIFDPFFTTKEVGKGTGLGLSLSYGIVKEHGGNIYARSRIGEGSSFIVEIPVAARLQEDPTPVLELLPQAIHFENVVRNKRILVVDDERYILDFFIEVFKMYSIEVDTADDGKLAMEKIMRQDYDLVITDFKMPLMNGKDLYHWISENRPQLTRHVVFVTGDTACTDTQTFFEKIGNRYLAKPFKIEEVKEAIQETLQRSAE